MWQDLAAIATVGQFIVVLVAAILALFQVQHMRRQNTSAAIRLLMRELGSDRMARALEFVYNDLAERLGDPRYVEELVSGRATPVTHPELVVVAYFNEIGLLVDYGLAETDPAVPLIAGPCLRAWRCLVPAFKLVRSVRPHTWSPFQSLVVRCRAVDFSASAQDYRRHLPRSLQAGWKQTAAEIEAADIPTTDAGESTLRAQARP